MGWNWKLWAYITYHIGDVALGFMHHAPHKPYVSNLQDTCVSLSGLFCWLKMMKGIDMEWKPFKGMEFQLQFTV